MAQAKKANEFRDMSVVELEAAHLEARKDLFEMVNEAHREKKVEKPHRIRQKRKEIARLLTVITEKEKG
jgi:large subunit ribosomal protein L29